MTPAPVKSGRARGGRSATSISRTSLPPAGAEGVADAAGSCGSGKAAGDVAVNAKKSEAMSTRDFEWNMA